MKPMPAPITPPFAWTLPEANAPTKVALPDTLAWATSAPVLRLTYQPPVSHKAITGALVTGAFSGRSAAPAGPARAPSMVVAATKDFILMSPFPPNFVRPPWAERESGKSGRVIRKRVLRGRRPEFGNSVVFE